MSRRHDVFGLQSCIEEGLWWFPLRTPTLSEVSQLAPASRRPSSKPTGHIGEVLRGLLAIGVLVAVFGFALPRITSYSSVGVSLAELSGRSIMILGGASVLNLVTYWPALILSLPGLRLREAAVVNQASTAVANTLPMGSALAVVVTFRILRGWGFTSSSITNQVVITGVWNLLVKLSLPVCAVVLSASSGEIEGGWLQLTAAGGVCAAVLIVAGAAVLRSPSLTRRVTLRIDHTISRIVDRFGSRHRPGVTDWTDRARRQMRHVLRSDGPKLSAAVVVSHTSLFLVLLASLRGLGVGSEELSTTRALVGFALVRLLSAIPITPGGAGVVELGYVGFFGSGADSDVLAQITAAVLLFRAVTFVSPIALGGVALALLSRRDPWAATTDSRGVDVGPEPESRT